MTMTQYDDAVFAAAAILTALTVILGALVKLYNVAKRIDGAIGVDDSGRTISQRLTSVEDAVLPSGKQTLPARVDQIELEVRRMALEVGIIREVVVGGKHSKHLNAWKDRNDT
jgi:hypothetical protein